MSFRFKTLILAALAVGAGAAHAQKPVPRSPLEIGHDYVEEARYLPAAQMEVGVTSNVPVALYRQNVAVRPGTPEAMAREYLSDHAALLRFASPALDDLVFRAATDGPAGDVVRFTQTVEGVPVHGPDVVVNIDNQHRVQYVLNGYKPDLDVNTTPSLAAGTARQVVLGHLGAEGALQADRTDLVVYTDEAGAYLAWQVRVVPEAPNGDWQAFVDAHSGKLLRVADRALYDHDRDRPDGGEPRAMIPTVEAARALALAPGARIDGTGMVFDPDPLSATQSQYGGGYVDGNDADTPELTAARSAVTLRDVTFDGSLYHLDGPYAAIREFESPNKGTFPQAAPDWSFTRSPDGFEAANTYYHIDTYMRYLNEAIGVSVMPYQYTDGVQFDAHGLNGADNSHYVTSTGRLAFGEGCVDDDEDADVIIHELGHGLHDWVTVGGLSQVNGLSEGSGDYFAASYSRAFGQWTPADPEYNWVFSWDGHNPCWPGRVTNYAPLYPGGLTGSIHTDGQMWSSTLMQIWDDIGREQTDTAVLEGLRMTNSSTNQQQAAQAVLQAAFNMGYSAADITTMYDHFDARGYDVVNPVPVEFTAFNGVASGRDVVLRWATASETNNAGFEVQVRSGDTWNVLAFVEGHGTTTEAQTYRHTAAGLAVGAHVFRLKQVDFDGAFEYSNEVEVTVGVPGAYELSRAYPNPFNPTTTFTLAVARDQQVSVALYDALGRQVQTLFTGPMAANERQTFVIDASDLPSGLYVYRVTGETFSASNRVTLVK